MKQFRRLHVPGDGDCFYHALRFGLQRLDAAAPDVAAIRRRVAARLRRTATSDAERDAAERAAQVGAWAENEEVSAAAAEFHVRIRVWEGSNGMWITFGHPDADERTTPLVYMHNAGNVHFEPITPVVRG